MKSQMSIEFLVGVIIILIIYIITLPTFSKYIQTNIVESESGKQICYTVSSAIDSAVIGGNNFSLNITLPNKIDGKDYKIFTTPPSSYITVDWGDGIFTCSITTQNIVKVIFNPCKVSVSNINNTIYISTVYTNGSSYNLGDTVNIYGGFYISNASLKIFNENGTAVLNKTITPVNHTFVESWNPTSKGKFIIKVEDEIYKTLNSEKIIYVT